MLTIGPLLVTNVIKIGGLLIGVHEAFGAQRPSTLAFAAFMMAGAQGIETVILSVLERIFASSNPNPSKDAAGGEK